MVKMIFEYEVSAENLEAYLRETRENIKPLWESRGCNGYYIWQESENPNRFVKEMYFDDVSKLKETMALKETDSVKEIFRKFAKDISRKIIVQKI